MIVSTLSRDIFPVILRTLGQTARILGQFEAYDVLAERYKSREALHKCDRVVIRVLEDLEARSCNVVKSLIQKPGIADSISRTHYLNGYDTTLKQGEDAPGRSVLYQKSAAIVSEGWNVEEENPAFGQVSTIVQDENIAPDNPFASQMQNKTPDTPNKNSDEPESGL